MALVVAFPDFQYADHMEPEDSLSLEELVRRHNVVVSPLPAMDLEIGMVWNFEGKLRIVLSVFFENAGSGPVVIVETISGLKRFSSDAQLDVWHIDGQPFIVDPPPEDLGRYVPGAGGGSSAPPAQDAAGIRAGLARSEKAELGRGRHTGEGFVE